MIQIKLSGGEYDGKVVEISEDIFRSGYLEMLAPLPEDIDLMAGCHELERLVYKRLSLTPYVWEVV